MPAAVLVPFSRRDADDVLVGRRRDDWAPGYPTEGDVDMAMRIVAGTKPPVSKEFPWGAWSVVLPDEGLVVGGAGFHDEPDDSGSVEVGYGIAEGFRGRGVASAAVAHLIDLARASGARHVLAGTDAENAPSIRVLEKAGFIRTDDRSEECRWELDLTT